MGPPGPVAAGPAGLPGAAAAAAAAAVPPVPPAAMAGVGGGGPPPLPPADDGQVTMAQHLAFCDKYSITRTRAIVSFAEWPAGAAAPPTIAFLRWKNQCMRAKTLVQWKQKARNLNVDEGDLNGIDSLSQMADLFWELHGPDFAVED
eukprot:TRINITY_DN14451_c1_g1_i1.p1 TRINITY_DN14451_c1_g1~~TRINITY_DN14451_c1_g1_i1.p1  ORF type:complete len:165 (-),score=44.78 TRINITY_DN14451_c1_g1_i1:1393-1833(-)